MQNTAVKRAEKAMKVATRYADWLKAAQDYDRLVKLDEWRLTPASPYYPYELLQEQINTLKALRKRHQIASLVTYLQEGLHRTLGELSDEHLYSVSRTGTKQLIDDYLIEISDTLNYLCDHPIEGLPISQKATLFRHARKNFGQTALMLSGGGAFGIYHLGVVKALIEQNLLPKVIAGSSMGAIVAGFVGTHSDAEILDILQAPTQQHFKPLKPQPLSQMAASHSLLDADQLEECISANIRSETFLEAYRRTRRVINITISPTRAGQKPRILNYKTAPHVLVIHGVKASCSIPMLFPTTQLMAKNTKGEIVPYMSTEHWADGAVSTDIPMTRLGRLHNANHFIVSQTNPHVLPFVKNRLKPGALPYLMDLASSSIHAQWHQFITVTKKRIKGRNLRFWLDRADALLGQDYLGDINIHPDFPLTHYFKVMSNPSDKEIEAFVLAGERATWPKIEMIKNQTQISRTLAECNDRLNSQVRDFPN